MSGAGAADDPEARRVTVALGPVRVEATLLTWKEASGDRDSTRMELHVGSLSFVAQSEEGYFYAMVGIRRGLETVGGRIDCYGSALDAYPSPMITSFGDGARADRLRMGHPARQADLVSVFGREDGLSLATVDEQARFCGAWGASIPG